jgi:hypothetical protein
LVRLNYWPHLTTQSVEASGAAAGHKVLALIVARLTVAHIE